MGIFRIENDFIEANTYSEARIIFLAKKQGGAPKPDLPPVPPKPAFLTKRTGPEIAPKPAALKAPAPVTISMISGPAPFAQPAAFEAPATAPAKPFELVAYRGEKSQWWPKPEQRLVSGLTVFEPWNTLGDVTSMSALFDYLRAFMVKVTDEDPGSKALTLARYARGDAQDFAQYLRQTGRPYALASARSTVGMFTTDYNYVIRIPNVRTFEWGPDLVMGPQIDYSDIRKIKKDYIVLNAETLDKSTILGFGHKTGTCEVTFMHDLPLKFVATCNGKAINDYDIASTITEAKYKKLQRTTFTPWLV